MKPYLRLCTTLLGALTLSVTSLPTLASAEAEVNALRTEWEHVNFELAASEQEAAYGNLLTRCDELLTAQPEDPQALT
ncbi:MAG: hypothetical protein NWS56_07500, partial [Haliea sp.]|nr:hypothetical protein [Haliea sp.]